MIIFMDRVCSAMPMVTATKASSKTTRSMAMAYTHTPMETSLKDRTIPIVDKERVSSQHLQEKFGMETMNRVRDMAIFFI
jgi:galactitol-specific phosphotransferase system IIC component